MFRVVIHRRVSKELKNLQRAHLNKFAEVLEILKTNPVPWKEFDIKKIEGEENTYRIRIGDFRVIYFIDKENRMIHILKLERRGRIY